MELKINNKNYHLLLSFPERISKLKKMKSIKLSFECDKEIEPEYNDLFIVSKSNLYNWVFEDCEIINKEYFTKEYYFKSSEEKVNYIKIEFTFNNVYGSNNIKLIEREIKIKKLLDE